MLDQIVSSQCFTTASNTALLSHCQKTVVSRPDSLESWISCSSFSSVFACIGMLALWFELVLQDQIQYVRCYCGAKLAETVRR